MAEPADWKGNRRCSKDPFCFWQFSSELFSHYSSGTTCTDLKSRQLKKTMQLLAYCTLFDLTSHHSFSFLTCVFTMHFDTRIICQMIHVRLAEETYCSTINRTETVT